MKVNALQIRRAKIEIVPLIDVVFFLLATFVMVSLSMTRNQGMQVQLPTASQSSKQASDRETVTLTVMENGEVYYNKEKISLQQLGFKLQTLKTSIEDPKVVLNAASGADFKLVVGVLDETRKVGIAKVGISTNKI